MSFVDQAVGQRFGRLVVIGIENHDRRRVAKCACDCGSTCLADPRMLKRGDKESCGCLRSEQLSTRRRRDLTGQIFGKLTVIKEDGVILWGARKATNVAWECACECGVTVRIATASLSTGNTRSCGCVAATKASNRGDRQASFSTHYHATKTNAVRRGIGFFLTCPEFEAIVVKDCTYCGDKPSRQRRQNHLKVNGIDRLDTNQPYVLDNCVPCCTICNTMKHVHSVDEFKAHIQRIINHSKVG